MTQPTPAAEPRADPVMAGAVVEELLRLLTITHRGGRRMATADVSTGGVPIRPATA